MSDYDSKTFVQSPTGLFMSFILSARFKFRELRGISRSRKVFHSKTVFFPFSFEKWYTHLVSDAIYGIIIKIILIVGKFMICNIVA